MPGNPHYFNHAQKIFEIGEDSTLGIVTWGLGGLSVSSHRNLVARLGDDFKTSRPVSVKDAAERWSALFWKEYSQAGFLQQTFADLRALQQKGSHDPNAVPDPAMRTADEETSLDSTKRSLIVGFCIGGYLMPASAGCLPSGI